MPFNAAGVYLPAHHPDLMPSAAARDAWLNAPLTYEKAITLTGWMCDTCGRPETLGDLMTWKDLDYLSNGELACADCYKERRAELEPAYAAALRFWYGPEQSTGSLGQPYFAEMD